MIEYVVVIFVRGRKLLRSFFDLIFAEAFLHGARHSGGVGVLRAWPRNRARGEIG
jgi:hypothetical protein